VFFFKLCLLVIHVQCTHQLMYKIQSLEKIAMCKIICKLDNFFVANCFHLKRVIVSRTWIPAK
jgi:hypothetical protein